MQPKYKHPTKGNPHGIVVRQHIHATRFIKKFAGPNGRVELFDKAASVPLRHAKPSDAIFCAYRRWDYKTESGLCVSLEEQFSKVLEDILDGQPFGSRDHRAISKYYCLWRSRFHLAQHELVDAPLNNIVALDRYMTEEERERMERRGYITISADHKLEGHFWGGPTLLKSIDMGMEALGGVRWAAVRALKGQFICADVYRNYLLMPVTPTLILVEGSSDGVMDVQDVATINDISASEAERFYFCKNHQLCPMSGHPTSELT